LATASRGIAEVITHHYTQNIDLSDAKQFCLIAELQSWDLFSGENRAKEALFLL
jgi:cell division protein FtsZ